MIFIQCNTKIRPVKINEYFCFLFLRDKHTHKSFNHKHKEIIVQKQTYGSATQFLELFFLFGRVKFVNVFSRILKLGENVYLFT